MDSDANSYAVRREHTNGDTHRLPPEPARMLEETTAKVTTEAYRLFLKSAYKIQINPHLDIHLISTIGTIKHAKATRSNGDRDGPYLYRLGRLKSGNYPKASTEAYYSTSIFIVPPYPHLEASFREPWSPSMLVAPVDYTQAGGMQLVLGRPDLVVGYHESVFSVAELEKLQGCDGPFKVNASGVYFPFLVVEYEGGRGNFYDSQTKCINSALVCMHNLAKLATMAGRGSLMRAAMAPALFCVVAHPAAVHVFCAYPPASAPCEYCLTEIASISIFDEVDLARCHKLIQNIMEWGRGPRLDTIVSLIRKMPSAGVQSGSYHG